MLGHQEVFRRLKPVLGLAINIKDLKLLIDLISVIVNKHLVWIIERKGGQSLVMGAFVRVTPEMTDFRLAFMEECSGVLD